MNSDSVALCETEVCFLHIQLVGTNVRLPKMHRIPLSLSILSLQGPQQCLSLGTIAICMQCCAVFSCMPILPEFTCVVNVRDQTR